MTGEAKVKHSLLGHHVPRNLSSRVTWSRVMTALCYAGAILCLSHPIPVAAARQEIQRTESFDFSKVEALARAEIASGIPSIALAVTYHGRIIWEHAYGVADKERHIPATTNTPYYLASVSKAITATALMQLVDSGKISLNKPVNDYLGAAKLSSPMWNPSEATVLRVATHTAGLTSYDLGCEKNSPKCSTDTDDLVRRYGVIVWQPGDHFDYSNADYGIIGQAIAHTSRESFPGFLQQHVFQPLGMNDCFLDSNTNRMRNAAARYDSDPPNRRMPRVRSTTPGASSIYCSVHDLALFGMFHLADHLPTQKQILPDRSIREMQKPLVSAGDGLQYGLGWWIQADRHGYPGVLAQGGTHDATAYLQLIPSEDIAIAMLWNSGTPEGDKLVDEVLSTLLPHYRDALAKAPPELEASSLVPNRPSEAILGTWSGSIQTYKETLPLVISISETGEGRVRLGSEPEVRIAHVQTDRQMLKWRMAGPAGLGDTGTTPYILDIKLYLHGETLMGAARTGPAPPATDGALLFYPVKLERP
jgi:CubicO group peptidase (beta-lactamase class C family)